ncbi:phosphotransferase [Aeromicrobium ginsengisoli]|nr:phosphotransferase [Aeromicrobium ginsengisoli]
MTSPTDAVATIDLPRSLEDVTVPWMSEALSARFPGTVVASMTEGSTIRGMATKIQLHLTYADNPHGLPPSMWLKTGFEKHSERSAELYAAEVNFFRVVAPAVPTNSPLTFFEAIDGETGNGVLLMEDLTLRGVRFGDQTQPLTPDVAASLLDVQARYHSFLAESADDLDLSWLTVGGAIHSVDVAGEYLEFWETASQAPRFRFVPEELGDPVRIKAGLDRMIANDRQESQWLVHGDVHLGNVFFDDQGNGGFLDWQTVMRGTWAFDVAYFIVVSLSVEDRRAHEQDLLRTYLARLEEYGGHAPSFEDAWLAYRQHVMWTFLMVLCPVERQAEEICTAHAERICAALVDLQVLESLGV